MSDDTEARELLAAEFERRKEHASADRVLGENHQTPTGSEQIALAAITTALNLASEARALALEEAARWLEQHWLTVMRKGADHAAASIRALAKGDNR